VPQFRVRKLNSHILFSSGLPQELYRRQCG